MDELAGLSDAEYLYKLRVDYIQALQLEDYSRIERVIVPEFWERFSKYYEEFARTWKEVSLLRLPIQVVIDPAKERQTELDWAEHVLKGQIEIVL
jgi:hypothetical protein